jgi:hypothetical protein
LDARSPQIACTLLCRQDLNNTLLYGCELSRSIIKMGNRLWQTSNNNIQHNQTR